MHATITLPLDARSAAYAQPTFLPENVPQHLVPEAFASKALLETQKGPHFEQAQVSFLHDRVHSRVPGFDGMDRAFVSVPYRLASGRELWVPYPLAFTGHVDALSDDKQSVIHRDTYGNEKGIPPSVLVDGEEAVDVSLEKGVALGAVIKVRGGQSIVWAQLPGDDTHLGS